MNELQPPADICPECAEAPGHKLDPQKTVRYCSHNRVLAIALWRHGEWLWSIKHDCEPDKYELTIQVVEYATIARETAGATLQ